MPEFIPPPEVFVPPGVPDFSGKLSIEEFHSYLPKRLKRNIYIEEESPLDALAQQHSTENQTYRKVQTKQ